MADEWDYTVQKALFCQGQGNNKEALLLWQKAARIRPLEHLGAFNYLLCLRQVQPTRVSADDFFVLFRDGVYTNYMEQLVLVTMLTSFQEGRIEMAIRMGVLLAQIFLEHREKGANVWDIPGEPSMVDQRGAAAESRSGANIIRCLEGLVGKVPFDSNDGRALRELLKGHRARDKAMQTPNLPPCPEKEIWWNFTQQSS